MVLRATAMLQAGGGDSLVGEGGEVESFDLASWPPDETPGVGGCLSPSLAGHTLSLAQG